jgi:GGDEF domain-containing protein
MTTVALPNSTVLELSARAPNPSLAQQVANTAGDKIVGFVQQYYSGYTIEVIDPAYLPSIPIEPNLLRDAAVALALGIVFGGVLATGDYYVRQWMEQSKKRPVYDADSLALTRNYLEGHLSKMPEAELQESGLAIIQLGGLRGAKDRLSLRIYRQIQRQAVERMFGELRGKDMVARWSDASFAIFMPNITREAAARLLDGVQTTLEEPQPVETLEQPFPLDPRIGAVTTGRGIRPPAMIQEAEAALKKAGNNGSRPVITAIEFSEPQVFPTK